MKKIILSLTLVFGIFVSNHLYAAIIEPAPPCPWVCAGTGVASFGTSVTGGWQVSEDICNESFINDLKKDITNCSISHRGTTYCLKEGLNKYGGYKYKNVNTGISWSGYWKVLINYCQEKGLWSNVIENPEIRYGRVSSINFTINNGDPKYEGKLLEQTSNRVTIQGLKNPGEKKLTTPSFNSPTLYFKNNPQGKIKVKINSEFGVYKNQKPEFNTKNGWEVESDGKNISVNNKKTDNLFYELGLKKVNLSRNGKNFNSQEDLKNFLKTSEFFEKLGFNKTEKENSLKYVLPRLPESNNYYLTILENPKTVTQLEITPKAKIIQKYFVIYPTTIPVKTFGELVYPEKISKSEEFAVKNYGEIIVKPEMFVIWE